MTLPANDPPMGMRVPLSAVHSGHASLSAVNHSSSPTMPEAVYELIVPVTWAVWTSVAHDHRRAGLRSLDAQLPNRPGDLGHGLLRRGAGREHRRNLGVGRFGDPRRARQLASTAAVTSSAASSASQARRGRGGFPGIGIGFALGGRQDAGQQEAAVKLVNDARRWCSRPGTDAALWRIDPADTWTRPPPAAAGASARL